MRDQKFRKKLETYALAASGLIPDADESRAAATQLKHRFNLGRPYRHGKAK